MIRTASDSLSTQSSLARKKGTTKWLSDEMSISSDRAAGGQRQRDRERQREAERRERNTVIVAECVVQALLMHMHCTQRWAERC